MAIGVIRTLRDVVLGVQELWACVSVHSDGRTEQWMAVRDGPPPQWSMRLEA